MKLLVTSLAVLAVAIAIVSATLPQSVEGLMPPGFILAGVLGVAAFVARKRRTALAKGGAVAVATLAVVVGLEGAAPSGWPYLPSALVAERTSDYLKWRGHVVGRTGDYDQGLVSALFSEPERKVASRTVDYGCRPQRTERGYILCP